MIKLIDGRGKDNAWISARLNRPSQLSFTTERKQVEEILSNIKGNGDQTVIEYTAEFDRVSYNCPKEMVVTQKEIEMAYDQVDRRYLKIMQRARKNIWEFHSKQLQNSWITYGEDGVIMGQNILPMERVGVYVPGGRAAYPSSVLMNIIPAKVAGVSEIIMVTPPGIDKTINPHTLVAAREAGCEKIFKVGGAQAVGALAFGTQTIP
jgi:histidinol dehydrogenase